MSEASQRGAGNNQCAYPRGVLRSSLFAMAQPGAPASCSYRGVQLNSRMVVLYRLFDRRQTAGVGTSEFDNEVVRAMLSKDLVAETHVQAIPASLLESRRSHICDAIDCRSS